MLGFLSRKNSVQHYSTYDVILDPEADLSKVYFKSAFFYYSLILSKIYEILNKTFSSKDLININYQLNDLYESLWDAFQKFGNREDFKDIHTIRFRTFKSLHGDFNYLKDAWKQEKTIYFDEIKRINNLVPQEYPIPNDLMIAFQDIDKFLKGNIEYWVTYKDSGEIILNDTYLLAKLNVESQNDFLFDYVIDNSRRKISRNELKEKLPEFESDFFKTIYRLGFKGELFKIFFSGTSKQTLYFKNDITEKDLNNISYSSDLLQEEINLLKRI